MMEDLIGQIIAWLFATTCYGLATWGILYFAFNAGVGKGISSGKTAPVPKTPPVRRPKENE